MTLLKYEISSKLGGQVEVAETKWDGWKLDNERVEVLAGNGFQDLEMKRISLELDPKGFFDRVWRVADIHVRELSLHLRKAPKGSLKYNAGAIPVEFDWKDAGKAFLPRKAEVEAIWVEQCNGSFDSDGNLGHWSNMELKLDREGSDYLLTIPRGELHLSQLPGYPLSVQKLKGRVKPKSFYINEGILSGEGGAQITLSGEGTFTGDAIIQGELKDFPVYTLLEKDWEKRVQGEINGDYTLKNKGDELKVYGDGMVENGMLVALPGLDMLAKQTGINKFRQISLDTCEYSYEILNNLVSLNNIRVESKDFLKARGSILTNGESGSGTVEIGVHNAVLDKMPAGTAEVFTKEEEDYSWANVSLTQVDGTWKDDLSPRIMSAVAKAFFMKAPEKATQILDGVRGILENAQSDGGSIKQEKIPASDLQKKGNELMEKGVKSLFDLLGR